MAGLLAFPQFVSLMSGVNPAAMANPPRTMADAEDERMFAANPNGDQLNQLLGAFLLGQNPQPQAAPTPAVQPAPGGAIATPQRARVSPWRVLDRVLGGETITGGLDAERARLTAEAMRPQIMAQEQENERIARALGPQALLALRTNREKLGEGLSAQYSPQVISAGGIQSVVGQGTRVGAPSVREFGDRIATTDPLTGMTSYGAARAPTFQEGTARLSASTANVAQDGRLVDTRTGAVIAEGIQRPDIQNVAPGGEALAFDAQGNIVNRVGSTQERPLSTGDQNAIDEAEQNITRVTRATSRAEQIAEQIASGELNLGPVTNLISGARNTAGRSNANSLNYDAMLQWAKEARNAVLQANTGVQTDQDAIRELDTILSGTNDEKVVSAALARYIEAQSQTAETLQAQVQRRSRGQVGGGAASSGAENIPRPSSRAEFNALPSGAEFIDPQGVRRRKP